MITQYAILVEGQIGETDCEAISEGFLAQPVNTISSAAYIVAGVWLVVRALRLRADETATQSVYGLALAGIGFGSIAFHGPMPPGARLFHDLTIAAVVILIGARNIGALRGWAESTVLTVFGLVTAAVGLVMVFSVEAGGIVAGVIGVGAIGIEIYLYRSGRRTMARQRMVVWLLAIVGLFALGGLANVFGRTGAPLCEPDSLLQGHAAWHALTATAFGFYGYVAFPQKAATAIPDPPQG